MKFTEELLATMYYRMNQARFFEETLKSISASDKINGVSHLSIGQEASAVGACMAIEKGDDMIDFKYNLNGRAASSLQYYHSQGILHSACV